MNLRDIITRWRAILMRLGFVRPRNAETKALATLVIYETLRSFPSPPARGFNTFVVFDTKLEYEMLKAFPGMNYLELVGAPRLKELESLVFNETNSPFHIAMYKSLALSGWRIKNTKTPESDVLICFINRPTDLELQQVFGRFSDQSRVLGIAPADNDLVEFVCVKHNRLVSDFKPWRTAVNEDAEASK